MRVCFEIFMRLSVRLCGGKKERTKRFRCVPLVPPARDPKKNANAHFVSFFDERKKLINRSSKKSFNQKKSHCQTAEKRIEFFFVQRTTFLFSAAIFFLLRTRSVKSLSSVELYHPRKYYSHHERQLFDVYEDDTNDDVLLLRLKPLLCPGVFFFFFFETVASNWTGREKKELFPEICNIVVIFITVGGKSG